MHFYFVCVCYDLFITDRLSEFLLIFFANIVTSEFIKKAGALDRILWQQLVIYTS
jgi:hypothetical protein